MSIIDNMVNKRYELYRELFDENKTTFWSEELKSWLVFDFKSINDLIKKSNLTANRKQKYLKVFELEDDDLKIIGQFYNQWLMYMEAPEHTNLRNILVPILTNAKHEELATSLFDLYYSKAKRNEEIDLEKELLV